MVATAHSSSVSYLLVADPFNQTVTRQTPPPVLRSPPPDLSDMWGISSTVTHRQPTLGCLMPHGRRSRTPERPRGAGPAHQLSEAREGPWARGLRRSSAWVSSFLSRKLGENSNWTSGFSREELMQTLVQSRKQGSASPTFWETFFLPLSTALSSLKNGNGPQESV